MCYSRTDVMNFIEEKDVSAENKKKNTWMVVNSLKNWSYPWRAHYFRRFCYNQASKNSFDYLFHLSGRKHWYQLVVDIKLYFVYRIHSKMIDFDEEPLNLQKVIIFNQ